MNAHLRLASDRLHDGVQVISCDWRHLYVNETAAADGRRSAAALVGERMQDCYPGIERTPSSTPSSASLARLRPQPTARPRSSASCSLYADAATTVLVEDDRGVREFVARSHVQHGYRVRVAEWPQKPGHLA